jgi:hypothetical protein
MLFERLVLLLLSYFNYLFVPISIWTNKYLLRVSRLQLLFFFDSYLPYATPLFCTTDIVQLGGRLWVSVSGALVIGGRSVGPVSQD